MRMSLMYTRRCREAYCVFFFIFYIDNILLIGNDVGVLLSVKIWLFTKFQMNDLGEVKFILGIKDF